MAIEPEPPRSSEDSPAGMGYVISAYLLWGLLPFYMKALSHVSPVEVVVHRILWSVPIAAALLWFLGRTGSIWPALTSPRTLGMAFITAGLISINWGIYVWAIISDQAIQAALGYYINPLFSIFLGRVFLREYLSPLQWAAIAIAAMAVGVLVWEAGALPLAGLGLMLTFGLYSLAKKKLPIGPNQGFLLEVLVLSVPALGYLIWLGGDGMFWQTAYDTWLLIGCGVVTAIPLLLFSNGAKRLRMSTMGILQYITPTMLFLIAVFAFGEPFQGARLLAFPMIWVALVLYSITLLGGRRA